MPLHVACLVLLALAATPLAGREKLALRHTALELPGAPAAVLAEDLDGDGRRDLAVVVAYTRWDRIGIEETTEMEGIEGLVEVLTVVPSLIERRELRLFQALGEGGYAPMGEPVELDLSVLSLSSGAGLLLAMTDRGVEALRLGPAGRRPEPRFELLWEEAPVHAGAGAFMPELPWLADLDRDGWVDVLFPAAAGIRPLLWRGGALSERATVPLPGDEHGRHDRFYPLPEVRDIDGDRLPDLLVRGRDGRWEEAHLLRGLGDGRFAPPVDLLRALRESTDKADQELARRIAFLGDLDGDGRGEYLATEEAELADDAGMRQEMRSAKRPRIAYAVHRAGSDYAPAPEPHLRFETEGYALGVESEEGLQFPGGLQDLDGDGRLDLVAVTLDFSMLQLVRVMATMSLSLGLDFHIWCQRPDGGFRPVRGLDLSGKFRLNLRNVRFHQLSQFAGDFDGDGRADFLQMGRGKTVTIHRGREGCAYPAAPDLTLELEEAPRNLALVRVRDLDGDGLSDLQVTQPRPREEAGVTPPVRLDLYLSGQGGRP